MFDYYAGYLLFNKEKSKIFGAFPSMTIAKRFVATMDCDVNLYDGVGFVNHAGKTLYYSSLLYNGKLCSWEQFHRTIVFDTKVSQFGDYRLLSEILWEYEADRIIQSELKMALGKTGISHNAR